MRKTNLAEQGRVKLIGADGGGTRADETSVDDLIASNLQHVPGSAALPDDEAMIGYTSGTTGYPKGAVHTHKSILGCFKEVAGYIALTDRDVIAVPLPLFQLSSFLVHADLPI